MTSGVCAVVGGQFGSEGKGLIVGYIAKQYAHHVRVGAANAGHTLYTDETHRMDSSQGGPWYVKHVMQQLPCAAYANPDAELYIGPGAIISTKIFSDELTKLQKWRLDRGIPAITIHVDPRAHTVTPEMIEQEAASDLADRIGSTSATAREGIGTTQAARVLRHAECALAGSTFDWADMNVELCDVPMILSKEKAILLEGTQGYGISLTTGEHPYVTSRNTTAAGLAADCGVAPNRLDRIILVVRTFPIRVAGNSGPFAHGSKEITWTDIGVNPEDQRTSVTKKIRRVATFSISQVREAAIVNGATEIALTFCDYLRHDLLRWYLVQQIEQETGLPVTLLGTGPYTVERNV